MADKRHIKVRDIVRDIRAGLDHSQLIEKYRVSPRTLVNILSKLVQAGVVTKQQAFAQTGGRRKRTAESSERRTPRGHLDFELIIYDVADPSLKGRVRDIGEKGVGTAGIPGRAEDVKTLAILPNHSEDQGVLAFEADVLTEVTPIVFEAVCRWYSESDDKDTHVAGFEVTDISRRNKQKLRKLSLLSNVEE